MRLDALIIFNIKWRQMELILRGKQPKYLSLIQTDAADKRSSVELDGRRYNKKKKDNEKTEE
mgnify:CR=1 FL=1